MPFPRCLTAARALLARTVSVSVNASARPRPRAALPVGGGGVRGVGGGVRGGGGGGVGRRRLLSTSMAQWHGHLTPPKPGEELHVTFIDKLAHAHTYAVSPGTNLLDIALDNNLDMEGACGGSAACSTCHVIVEDEAMFERMPEAEDDENDMLDLAFGLTETSRLGCQVCMTKEIDGLVVRLPGMTRNLQKGDFEKK